MSSSAVLLDLDGTIINSESLLPLAWKAFFETTKLLWKEDRQLEFQGMRLHDQIDFLKKNYGLTLEKEKAVLLMHNLMFRCVYESPDLCLMPGVESFLAWLETQSCKRGIVTSAGRTVLDGVLKRFQLEGFFPITVTATDLGDLPGKPEPYPYLMASERLAISPSECVSFEDSVHGFTSAKRAGMKTVAVNALLPATDYPLADLFVNSFEDPAIISFLSN